MAEKSTETEIPQKGWRKYLDALLKPSVIAVVLTALVGPPTIQEVNQQIEQAKIDTERVISQRELQAKILAQLLDYANAAGTDGQALQKISLLTTFVKDNEKSFGLVFPSIPHLIAQNQRFERNKTGMELASLKSTLAMQDSDMKDLQQALERTETTLKQLRENRDDNGPLIAQQELEHGELDERLRREQQIREGILLSIRSRQAQLDAMDQFIAQEMQQNRQVVVALVDKLKSEQLSQKQLTETTEQLLQQLQDQVDRARMLNQSFTALQE